MQPDHQTTGPGKDGKEHAHGAGNGSGLRLVAWETTRNCNLSCMHCRASATNGPYAGELDTRACRTLLDQIAEVGNPIVILTGGEPLLRPDIFDIAKYGTAKGLRMVMAPNGTLITPAAARQMADAGIRRISISLDGATRESHDRFRGVDGAFDGALNGIRMAREAGIEFQINTTITKTNLDQIPRILDLAVQLGAAAHHIFLLVPTGRGKYIVDQEISAAEYEKTLNWFYDQREKTPMQLKATCAPHYYRILRQRAGRKADPSPLKTMDWMPLPGDVSAAPASALSPTPASSSPAASCMSTAGTLPALRLPTSGSTRMCFKRCAITKT